MRILTHTLLGVLAIALVYPTSVFILAFFGTGAGSILFIIGLLAATILALQHIRATVDSYLVYRAKKRLDTADKRG